MIGSKLWSGVCIVALGISEGPWEWLGDTFDKVDGNDDSAYDFNEDGVEEDCQIGEEDGEDSVEGHEGKHPCKDVLQRL